MFKDVSELIEDNTPMMAYGCSAIDIDGRGQYCIFVAGYGCDNKLLKWNGRSFVDICPDFLKKPESFTIAACGGDFLGQGTESLYVLNADTFAGQKKSPDQLFVRKKNGQWIDLFSHIENMPEANFYSGRSICTVDRFGSGLYGFVVANYGGPFRFYEFDFSQACIKDSAKEIGMNLVTGGRSLVAAPIISETHMDIFACNENSPNYFFRARDDGSYVECAKTLGLSDPFEHGRGVALSDFNRDGKLDIIYGNWEGEHRLFINTPSGFKNYVTPSFANPCRVRTIFANDFLNSGHDQIFFNNMGDANRFFVQHQGSLSLLECGDAQESGWHGTGGVVGDFAGDGQLMLLLAHGEQSPQPLRLYKSSYTLGPCIRVQAKRKNGAPARGALVHLFHDGKRVQTKYIDAGSGYLCQMEPVAHFGLGENPHDEYEVEVIFPGGIKVRKENIIPGERLKIWES